MKAVLQKYVPTCVRTCKGERSCVPSQCEHTHTYIHTQIHALNRTLCLLRTLTQRDTYAHIHTHIHAHAHTNSHKRTQTQTHKHTHTYKHTQQASANINNKHKQHYMRYAYRHTTMKINTRPDSLISHVLLLLDGTIRVATKPIHLRKGYSKSADTSGNPIHPSELLSRSTWTRIDQLFMEWISSKTRGNVGVFVCFLHNATYTRLRHPPALRSREKSQLRLHSVGALPRAHLVERRNQCDSVVDIVAKGPMLLQQSQSA